MSSPNSLRNTFFLFLSVTISILLFKSGFFHELVRSTPELKLVHTFVAGAFFTSVFTLPTSIGLIIELEEIMPIKMLVPVAALGAMFGDLLIFKALSQKFVRDETRLVLQKLGKIHLRKIIHTPYFTWTMTIIGALVIASPLPDELGIALMSLGRLNTRQFMLISFVVNCIGILLVAEAIELF